MTVSVGGYYSVVASPYAGYLPTYSTGCSGSLISGQQATCIITESIDSSSLYTNVVPYSYTYPYTLAQVACSPAYQTVALGQSATVTATGGSGGLYNWTTPERSYVGAGPVFTTQLQSTGMQMVTVSSGVNTQAATCTVNVVGTPPATTYPYIHPTYPASAYIDSGVVVANETPALPNTGVEPLSVGAVAATLVGLVALGIFLLPYVRKTITTVLR